MLVGTNLYTRISGARYSNFRRNKLYVPIRYVFLFINESQFFLFSYLVIFTSGMIVIVRPCEKCAFANAKIVNNIKTKNSFG